MPATRVAPPLAGTVLGSAENSFVIAEWQDPAPRPDRRDGLPRSTFIETTTKLGTYSRAHFAFKEEMKP